VVDTSGLFFIGLVELGQLGKATTDKTLILFISGILTCFSGQTDLYF